MLNLKSQTIAAVTAALLMSSSAHASSVSITELASEFFNAAISATAQEVNDSVRSNVQEAATTMLTESGLQAVEKAPAPETEKESDNASKH